MKTEAVQTLTTNIHGRTAVFSRYSDGSFGVTAQLPLGTYTRRLKSRHVGTMSFDDYVNAHVNELNQYLSGRIPNTEVSAAWGRVSEERETV